LFDIDEKGNEVFEREMCKDACLLFSCKVTTCRAFLQVPNIRGYKAKRLILVQISGQRSLVMVSSALDP